MTPPLNLISTLRFLLRRPRATRDEIAAFQNIRLRHLVAHAYDRVPYYRRLFDKHGVKPSDIQTTADLSAIPITSRQDLQSLPVQDTVARGVNPERLIVHTTSGSTGQPLTIRRTWLEERTLGLLRLRAHHNFGLRMRDKRASLILRRPSQASDSQLPLRFLQATRLYRMLEIDCLQDPRDIIRRLTPYAPDVLTGFPGVLRRIALSLSDDDRRVLRPRFVAVDGEVLTPLMRRQISAAFQAPVFETYGSHEFNLLAWECKETGAFHVCDDGIILEVVQGHRVSSPRERGEVVGTSLHSFAMPFIRYRLGDIVTQGAETCSCGRPFSTIQAVQGRMIDYFLLPRGRMIHPYEILVRIFLVGDNVWIQQYRLVQERENRIVLQVVPFSTPSPERVVLLKDHVIRLLGPEVDFDVALVPHLSLEPSGKFRVSRSLVQSHYDGIDWDQMASEERR